MQGQTIITTHDVDELVISTVIRLIQRRAFLNLWNIIAKTHSADIARYFSEHDHCRDGWHTYSDVLQTEAY